MINKIIALIATAGLLVIGIYYFNNQRFTRRNAIETKIDTAVEAVAEVIEGACEQEAAQ